MDKGDYMEPLFANKCIYTKDVFRESLFGYNKRKKALTFIILAFLIIVILIQLLLYSVSSEIYLALFTIVLSALVFIVLPIIQANLSYKRSIELHQEPITALTTFYDDHFVSTAQPSNATITVKYDQVKRVIATKQLYLLVIRLQLFYIIDKNGFEKINMVEFEKFIKENAPKAKFHL